MTRVLAKDWKPRMAAVPVSPEVAVKITIPLWSSEFSKAVFIKRGRHCKATSLKARVGPWKSSR